MLTILFNVIVSVSFSQSDDISNVFAGVDERDVSVFISTNLGEGILGKPGVSYEYLRNSKHSFRAAISYNFRNAMIYRDSSNDPIIRSDGFSINFAYIFQPNLRKLSLSHTSGLGLKVGYSYFFADMNYIHCINTAEVLEIHFKIREKINLYLGAEFGLMFPIHNEKDLDLYTVIAPIITLCYEI